MENFQGIPTWTHLTETLKMEGTSKKETKRESQKGQTFAELFKVTTLKAQLECVLLCSKALAGRGCQHGS